MHYLRRSRIKSSRGHVRVEPASPWLEWGWWAVGAAVLLVVVVLVVQRVVLPAFRDEETAGSNRTWLEYAWTAEPVNDDAVSRLAKRLKDNEISRVYLEAAAWRRDGLLQEGDNAQAFVEALRRADSGVEVLLWLRMSGEEIANSVWRDSALALAQKAVQTWGLDGVQLNSRAIPDGSEAYINMVRGLNTAIGADAVLSLTVPPDRIPSDPDVPIGTTVAPELTWDVNFKERVGLLDADEIVLMAHASGLDNADAYRTWVAYQVVSYASVMSGLDKPPTIIVALPTYDTEPEHDPAVETVQAAALGIRDGIKAAGSNGTLIAGVGLYEYKTTDSLEWVNYRDYWLKGKAP